MQNKWLKIWNNKQDVLAQKEISGNGIRSIFFEKYKRYPKSVEECCEEAMEVLMKTDNYFGGRYREALPSGNEGNWVI